MISAVTRIIEQYDALENYFRIESFDQASGAAEINDMLNNRLNKLYLQFLEFILPTFTDMNLEFQSETPKIHKLYPRIYDAFKFLSSCFIKPDYLRNIDIASVQYRDPQHFLPLEKIYLGPKVLEEMSKNVLTENVKNNFRLKCLDFYIEAISQIWKRFPFNSREVQILKLLTILHPSNISSTESIGPLASRFPNMVTDVNTLDREFRYLKYSGCDFSLGEIEFWRNICNIEKGDGSLVYPELAKFVKILFSLPHSSASVERLFFYINLNKTKLRNRLGATTISGILHSKRLINIDNNSCFNFPITSDIIKKHNNNMYS